jgi:putative DNA primase/helicase
MFSFQPRFKVTIIGNDKPTFQGAINDALKRRLRMVEFANTARPIDPGLKSALASEAPGVLRWMINGLLDMLSEPGGKLFIADSVLAATDEYFNENDQFGQWVSECLEAKLGASVSASDALKSWQDYRGMNGGGQLFNRANEFRAEMQRRGYVWKVTKTGKIIKDIALKSAVFTF